MMDNYSSLCKRQTLGLSVFLSSLSNTGVFLSLSEYTGLETTLDPPPQPQLQASQEIYTERIKISSMSGSGVKFHEHVSKFNH